MKNLLFILSIFATQYIIGQEIQENKSYSTRVSNSSDDSRFANIKASLETASEEIDFWARQMSEHALFVYLGLDDQNLKAKALELHQKLEAFIKEFKTNPKDLAIMNKILPLLKAERAFQIEGLKTIESGKWIGWIFPSFFNHITLELDYLVDKLNGIIYSAEDEASFWNRNNSEDVAVASHLLDPSERDLVLKADKISQEFVNIPKNEKDLFIALSLKASKELDKFNQQAKAAGSKIKSIIHPALLEHVIRENERSIQILSKLGLHKEAKELADQHKEQVTEFQNA